MTSNIFPWSNRHSSATETITGPLMESKREKENAGQKTVDDGNLLNIAYHLLKYKDDSCISIR